MVDFSIIIPVYNAEKTLEKCLKSIDAQTFLNYEVILIDDGSTDHSLSICKRYEMQNQKYRVVHQLNTGPSAARNVGLDMAIGKWFCFVDSDDSIEKTYLQDIFDVVQKYDADVVFFGHHKVYKNEKKEIYIPCELSDTNIKTILELSEQDMFGYTWIKAFRRKSVKEIRFDKNLNLFEDEVFTCQAMPNCKKIAVLKKPIYNYYVGDGSSLIGRTYEDYCLKCDKVYTAWKSLIADDKETEHLVIKKANVFVSRCYYYAFERQVNLQTYFSQLKGTTFFQEHTENFRFDDSVRNCDYKKMRLEKMKYQTKVRISALIHRKRTFE